MKTSGNNSAKRGSSSTDAAVAAPLRPLQLAEVGRGQLVRPVLQQPGEQQVARLEQREVLLVLDVAGRQQPGSLQVEQGRGHDEELGRLAEVPLSRPGDVGDELVGDLRQGDFGDVELAPGDQAQQQVERTLEVVQPHPERAVVEPGAAGPGTGSASRWRRSPRDRLTRHPRPDEAQPACTVGCG